MPSSRLSTRGRLGVPREVRDRHGWKAGTVLDFVDTAGGVLLRAREALPRTRPEDLVGLARCRGPRRSLAEMEEGIARGARERR